MICPCHHHITPRCLYGLGNAFIISRNQDTIQPLDLAGLFIHVLDHRLATQQCERFPGKAGGTVACRNESDNFHTQPMSITKLNFWGLYLRDLTIGEKKEIVKRWTDPEEDRYLEGPYSSAFFLFEPSDTRVATDSANSAEYGQYK